MNPNSAYALALNDFCQVKIPATEAYQNNQTAGLNRALASNYPLIKMILSDSLFNALASVFARHYQPLEWDINRYGEGFSEFLLSQQHSGKADAFDWHWLAQIAELEYTIIRLYYQPPGEHEYTIQVAEASQVIQAIQLHHPYVVCFNPQQIKDTELVLKQHIRHSEFAIMVSAAQPLHEALS